MGVLSTEQRERVRAAVDAAPLGDYPPAIAALRTPAELHQFVLNYNCNDGFGPLWEVIGSPHCDRGTALYVYWQFADVVTDPARRVRRENPQWDAAGLIGEIERRYPGGFAHGQVAFDPREYLGWNRVIEYRYRKQGEQGMPPFPRGMLDPSPGEPLPFEEIIP